MNLVTARATEGEHHTDYVKIWLDGSNVYASSNVTTALTFLGFFLFVNENFDNKETVC